LLRARRRWLAGLFGFTLMVTLYNAPFSIFLVKFLNDKGRSDWYAGLSLSIFFAAGAVGGIIGGTISDRFGRRVVLVTTLLISPPLFYLYLWLENGAILSILVLVLAGMISMANRPIQLALAQDILPEARGQMSGMMLAFGFVSMSIITLAFGAIADRVGTDTAMWYVPFFAFLALPFVRLLPRRGESPPMPSSAL
jgi:FSR family fosmidomycin resistance protein-like MFS transporter